MKNILLIITLFISWNAVAEEKTWFCVSEDSGGLDYQNGKWVVKRFIPPGRITIRQKKDRLIFPKYTELRRAECKTDFDGWIYCSINAHTFVLNPANGHATSANYIGHLMGSPIDSLVVSPWKCESF